MYRLYSSTTTELDGYRKKTGHREVKERSPLFAVILRAATVNNKSLTINILQKPAHYNS